MHVIRIISSSSLLIIVTVYSVTVESILQEGHWTNREGSKVSYKNGRLTQELEGAQRVHISAKWILQLFYLFITVRLLIA